MRHEVFLTAGAEQDLDQIYDYLSEYESTQAADHVLNRLVAVAETLSSLPERGSHPTELLALGIREYRQVIVDPYLIVYRVIAGRVYVHLIADGRRDMESLLARRLLGG